MDSAIDLIKLDSLGAIEMVEGDVTKFFSSTIRGMVQAPQEKKLVVADFAAIEARVLGWLAGSEDMLNQFRNGEDLYKDMASKIYKTSVDKITQDQRGLGKAAILGAGFGMGSSKFYDTCLSWGIEVSESMAKRAIDTYRETYGEVKKLWGTIEKGACKAVLTGNPVMVGKVIWYCKDDFLKCELPSGRCLHYYKPEVKQKPSQYGSNDELSYFDKDIRVGTYGGRLVENITQAVARDIMAEAMLSIDEAGFEIVLSVHDEVIAEVDENLNEAQVLASFLTLMTEVPNWANGCPINAEGWIGKRYKK